MLFVVYYLFIFNVTYYYFCEKVEFWPFLGPWVNACPDPFLGGFGGDPILTFF